MPAICSRSLEGSGHRLSGLVHLCRRDFAVLLHAPYELAQMLGGERLHRRLPVTPGLSSALDPLDPRLDGTSLGPRELLLQLGPLGIACAFALGLNQRRACCLACHDCRTLLGRELVDSGRGTVARFDQFGQSLRSRHRVVGHVASVVDVPAWSASQTRSDNKREDRRIAADRGAAEEARRDATLQTYLDQMSGLMLNKNLLTSTRGDPVRAVARTVTLATLRRLDGERKAEVVSFLFEAHLLVFHKARVGLQGADLRDTNLGGANLEGADLRGADLRDAHANHEVANLEGADLRTADLRDANLEVANLEGADLRGAILEGADLEFASLEGADLRRASLGEADLRRAILEGAFLRGAILVGANLEGANLGDADLRGAILEGADLRRAILEGANLEGAFLGGADLRGANLRSASLEGANNLDLGRFITGLPPERQKVFLDSQKLFLDSLSREELARFKLSPEKLAQLRKDASGT